MRTLLTYLLTAALFLTVSLFIAPSKLIAQPGATCGCADVPDLVDLLGMYNVGLNKVQQIQSTVKPTDMMNEILPEPPPNPTRMTRGESVLKAVQAAMDMANNPGTRGGTPCAKAIDDFYKDRLDGSYRNYRTEKKLGKEDDIFNFMPVESYLGSLKEAFTRTVAEILRRLAAVPRSCRPGDWFGTITVVETRRNVVNISVPGTDRFNKGTEEVTDDTSTRTGTIWLSGNASNTISTWRASGKLINSSVHTGFVDCDPTIQKESLVGVQSSNETVYDKSGSVTDAIEINPDVSEDGRHFKVSFQIPAVDISTATSETDTVTGGCPGMARNTKKSGTSTGASLGPIDVQSKGPIFPGEPQKVSGSDPQDLVPRGFSVPGVRLTHNVVVTYNLYKFR